MIETKKIILTFFFLICVGFFIKSLNKKEEVSKAYQKIPLVVENKKNLQNKKAKDRLANKPHKILRKKMITEKKAVRVLNESEYIKEKIGYQKFNSIKNKDSFDEITKTEREAYLKSGNAATDQERKAYNEKFNL